jgi:Mrp family chromosome partitioning ATPase
MNQIINTLETRPQTAVPVFQSNVHDDRLEELIEGVASPHFKFARLDQKHDQPAATHLSRQMIAQLAAEAQQMREHGLLQGGQEKRVSENSSAKPKAENAVNMQESKTAGKDPFGLHLKPQQVSLKNEPKPYPASAVNTDHTERIFRAVTNFDEPLTFTGIPTPHFRVADQATNQSSVGQPEAVTSQLEDASVPLTGLLQRAFPRNRIETGTQQVPDIRQVEIGVWPEIVEKMLLLGTATVQRLAEVIREHTTGSANETVIASKTRGCGSSTITMALARWYAAAEERVLVVDADIHAVGVTKALGLHENRSWVTVTREMNFLEQGCVRDAATGIAFAALQPLRLRTIWQPFIFDHLASLVATVHRNFDRVLIDVGTPQQLISELSGNSSLATSALVVTKYDELDEEATYRIKTNLVGVGIENVLFAQNFARKSAIVE